MGRLGPALVASVVLSSPLGLAVRAAGAPARTPTWTVVSNGVQVDVPASWPVFSAPELPCPRPGGAVWLGQPVGLPAPVCPLFDLSTPAVMVVIGRLGAPTSGGTATTVNGLSAVVSVASHGAEISVSADVPARQAELRITSFGVPATRSARLSAQARARAIVDSARAARDVYRGLPLPTGPPLPLSVTSVVASLAPYNPTVGNQGIPIEVVHYRLARSPTVAFVCQIVVRRHGRVVGVGASSYGASGPESAPLPAGLTGRDQVETSQLSGPTFTGGPGDATVVCRPG